MAQVLRYQLDNLGSALFESLVQSLLSSELGLSVEAWGGSGDHGRDAYAVGPLNYPTKHTIQDGPFIFQAKFVAGANAANANPGPSLKSACLKEAQIISERQKKQVWQNPKHYLLFTNVPITPTLRAEAEGIMRQALPDCTTVIKGANDIANLLDSNESVARSFPFVVSMNAIQWTVFKAVHNGVIQRSNGAQRAVQELFQVFVRTQAYDEAWQKLRMHKFVVLEGPPEVGKTAIGWMIASYLSAKSWEVIDCSVPTDFFGPYDQERKQVFIADDAFGRTEYKVNLGDQWAADLHKILAKLDSTHILIWTTRGHILKTALREISLQGQAVRFPRPSDVLVDASHISRIERALMLYRHARAAGLEEFARAIIKDNAELIIDNSHFTPLRISRFVADRLPELARQHQHVAPNNQLVRNAIDDELRNPTDALRKAFNKLTPQQKRILLAVLDCGQTALMPHFVNRLDALGGLRGDLTAELNVLHHAFLSVQGQVIKWIHPSNRDLVIEQLEQDSDMSLEFLRSCSFEGLGLAVSHTGGAKGRRAFPLMNSDEAWTVLQHRLAAMTKSAGQHRLLEILRILRSSLDAATHDPRTHKQMINVATSALEIVRDNMKSGAAYVHPQLLDAFIAVSTAVNSASAFPDISKIWVKSQELFYDTVSQAVNEGDSLDSDAVLEFAKYADSLNRISVDFFNLDALRSRFSTTIKDLIGQVVRESNEPPPDYDPDMLEGELERFSELEKALETLVAVFPELQQQLQEAAGSAAMQASYLREKSNDAREDPDEWAADRFESPTTSTHGKFTSIADIFRDL
jgi:hypothetical protein